MPEGDTLRRVALSLARWLAGARIERFSSPLPALRDAGLEGVAVARVESRGKNLLIHFDDGRALHTHLAMTGSWHVYVRGRPWKKSASCARAVIETREHAAVCFLAPTVRLLTAAELRRDESLGSLGPDVLGDDFDMSRVVASLRAHDPRAVAEVLTDQRVVSGIGNVYKSELLFFHGIDPFTPVARVSDVELMRVLQTAREWLRRNVAVASEQGAAPRFAIGARRTRFGVSGPRLWVYERAGEPCLRCEARVTRSVQGQDRRSTYHCHACQRAR